MSAQPSPPRRVALITGGAQGLGAAAAAQLLRDGFAGVMLLDRSAEALAARQRELSKIGACEVLEADLLDAATPAKAMAKVRERFGDVRFSPVYRTPAVGFEGPDFLNAAAQLDTDMDVHALNQWLHALEDAGNHLRDEFDVVDDEDTRHKNDPGEG